MSPKQQLAQATQAANQSLAPSVLGANQAITQTQTDARNQADASKAAYAALAQLQGHASDQVSSLFKNAGDAQATYGKGFSDQVQGQLDQATQGSNDLLSKMGSPQQLQSAGPSAQSVLYNLGGYSPASVLNQQGAAFGAAAANLPSESYGLGIEGAKAATNQGNADVLKLRQQLATIQAQKPGLIQQALQQLQSGQAGLSNDYATQQARQQQLQLESQAYGLNVDKFNYGVTKDAAAAAAPSASLTNSLGYLVDKAGNPVVGKDGKIRLRAGYTVKGGQIVKIGSGSKVKTLSRKDQLKFQGMAALGADHAKHGFADTSKDPIYKSSTPGDPNGWSEQLPNGLFQNHHPAISYQAALEEARKAGIPIAYAIKALNRWYGPGHKAAKATSNTGFGITVTSPPLPSERG